jgi:hypothetical protein
MAVKIKTDLKLVIDDLSMLLVQKTPIEVGTGNTITINPDYELPVTVDTLQTTGGEPTISHYKVIGLDADWTSSSTPGEWTVQFTVPTMHTDVLKFAFGDDAVVDMGSITNSGVDSDNHLVIPQGSGEAWSGVKVGLTAHKITCSLVITNGAKDKLVIFRTVDLYAHVMKEANGDPYCIQFNGTVTSDGSNDMMVLTKNAG